MLDERRVPLLPRLKERKPLTGIKDIQARIGVSSNPSPVFDRALNVGTCGMGMPVLQSAWMLGEMRSGEVLKMMSQHPCSYSDIHNWARHSSKVILIAEEIEGDRMIYYLKKA